MEQAVARAVRDNLENLRRQLIELEQAIADLIAAAGSTRAANALPPMLRAQAASAALAAALETLSQFLTRALQAVAAAPPVQLSGVEPPAAPAPPILPPRDIPVPMAAEPLRAVSELPPVESVPGRLEIVAAEAALEAAAEEHVAVAALEPEPVEEAAPVEPAAIFDVSSLGLEEQELHRRANRVAKVSMQDIKMLRPEEVRLGVENRDLCARLRNDLDKARKEYDRRFQAILHHPVDYFYHWMVEILAEGDHQALGEYPYPSPVLRH